MRRPVSIWAAAFAAGIWTANSCATGVLFLLITAGVCFLLRAVNRNDLRVAACFFVVGMLLLSATEAKSNSFAELIGQNIMVEGRITDVLEKEDYLQLVVESREHSARLLARLYIKQNPGQTVLPQIRPSSLAGRDVAFSGTIEIPVGARNPGGFDYSLYLKTQKIAAILNGDAASLEINGNGSLVLGPLLRGKHRFLEGLEGKMKADCIGLLAGMLFGETASLDPTVKEAFRSNGTAHILAVSGIHIGIVFALMSRLFRRRRSWTVTVISLGALFLYGAMADFSSSVVRAVVMIGLYLLSRQLHRRYDLLNAASVTGLLMLLENPYQLFHSGFQLSFLAILTMALLFPFSQRLWERVESMKPSLPMHFFGRYFLPLIVIQIGTAPVIAYLFQTLPLAAVFLNLPVIALAGVLIPTGMGLFFLSAIDSPLFLFAATGVELLLRSMLFLNFIPEAIGFSALTITRPRLLFIGVWYLLLFFLCSEGFWVEIRRRNYPKIRFALLILLCIAVFFGSTEERMLKEAELIFVDVGQGDCLHIKTRAGKNILIDGGGSVDRDVGKSVLFPYFLQNGIDRIDLAIATHLHDDHYQGIASLCNLMRVDKLGVFEGNSARQFEITDKTGLPGGDIMFLAAGDRIKIEEGIDIEILYPEKGLEESDDENYNSLILKINYNDISVLMTGDLGFEGEEALMDMYGQGSQGALHADILKVGHHGSRYSTSDEFLDSVAPLLAVFQVGRNNYGHPHKDVFIKMEKRDIMYFRNDVQGAILFDINGSRIRADSMLP